MTAQEQDSMAQRGPGPKRYVCGCELGASRVDDVICELHQPAKDAEPVGLFEPWEHLREAAEGIA